MNEIINIANIVESPICDKAEDGEKIYILAKNALKEKKQIVLSFINVEVITSEFLDKAIAKLYYDFTKDEIKKYVHIEHLSLTGDVALKRVVEDAKMKVNGEI